MTTWIEHVERWKDCQKCPLAQQRSRICIARGNIPSDVVFIGEAPGASEDSIGFPFKGPAGHKMDWIINNSIPSNVTHSLINLVCCYPREAKARGDNKPERDEILACRPRLIEYINIAQPRLIIYVGRLAEEYTPNSTNVPSIEITHPAYILSRLPKAQQGFEFQKCIVQVRRAVQGMLQSTPKKWVDWEVEQPKPTKKTLRTIYGFSTDNDDQIPF